MSKLANKMNWTERRDSTIVHLTERILDFAIAFEKVFNKKFFEPCIVDTM